MPQTEWRLKGDWIKNCNCAFGCPCDFNCATDAWQTARGWSACALRTAISAARSWTA